MLKISLAFTIGVLTILSRFYPMIIGLVPLIGIIVSIMGMFQANKFQIFFATLAMAVCIVGVILVILVPGPITSAN